MEFQQKKGSVTHTFKLEEDGFNFAYKDKSGSGDLDISYADLPNKTSVSIEQNDWLRNVGLLWMAIGVAQIGWALYTDAALTGKGFWLLVGGVCVVWSQATQLAYTVFKTEQGGVFVIQDKQHDEIINALQSRKKQQLLAWYGDVNPDNELQTEIQKFHWLAEQGVLTQEESEQKIAQAQLLHNEQYFSPENGEHPLN